MKSALRIASAMTLLAVMTACGGNPGETPPASVTALTAPPASAAPADRSAAHTVAPGEYLTLTELEFPRLDGSTATIPLGEAVAAVIMGKNRADCAEYSGFSGTSKAYESLVAGKADLLVVYEPAEATKNLIKESGVELEYAAIGRDALVFLVNSANSVNGLTTEQIRDIYSGKTTNWRELGGADAAIHAYQRNETAGSQALMVKLVMKGLKLMEAPANFIEEGMTGLLTAIAAYDNGGLSIGYNVFYHVTKMEPNPDIKILDIDGITPSNTTISKGEYPFVNDFYAVIRKDAAAASPERRVFDWLQSPEGAALVEREGYASISAGN